MKHVLVVSYYFPPMGGVPVRRMLRFLRHLPEHGWRASVLTADRPFDPHHPLDPEGLAHLPPCEAVLRAPARPGAERLYAWGFRRLQALGRGAAGRQQAAVGGWPRRWLHETLAFPDPKRAWIRGAVALGREAGRRERYDAVLGTGYPWSDFVVADRVGTALGAPVVMDYRDAWTLNPRGLWSGPRSRRLEAQLVGRAAAVVTVTHWITEAMRRRFGGAPGRYVTIANAYDPAELPERDPSPAERDRLRLVYTGTFNDALPPSRFDRTPYHLLAAVERLAPAARAALRVELVGQVGPRYRAFVGERGLDDVVRMVGPVPHERALRYQRGADVLLLVLYACPGAEGDLTGKLLEYAGARRPVLALAPEGEAARFVRERGLGRVVDPESPERIARELEALVASWRRGELARDLPEPKDLQAGARTAELAALLDRLAAPTGQRRPRELRSAG